MNTLTKPLFVRSTQGKIGGVCLGLANSFDTEVWIFRTICILTCFLWGSGILLYLILMLILPREDQLEKYHQKKILGVCLKLSKKINAELGVVRLISFLLLFASLGLALVVYFSLFFMLND
ncbi:MAG: PspC domain-containing protein [Bacteriovoracaceae bacterium]|nr:PspC domain-containing protein [Bacteriovoracaceae bacterium]